MQRKTVVLVCMVDSIHVARWIAQFDPTEVKFILFPSGPNRRVHPKIVEMIAKGKKFDNQITIVPFGGKLSLPLWALDRFFNDRIRGLLLRRIIKKTLPDFVHALEFQHAGYVSARALEDKNVKVPFIATNYGSDIYWFMRFPQHLSRIREVLQRADFYSAECNRDVPLAKNLGFNGTVVSVAPNAGGIDIAPISAQERPSLRTTIAVKGYQNWVGRAALALLALDRVKEHLRGFTIEIYSANLATWVRALIIRVRSKGKLNIRVHLKHGLAHDEMTALFRRSRIYVGVSLSDGISTSLLEAMSEGAFPIQTDTSCANEWVENGKGGFLISPHSIDDLAEALSAALRSEALVDQAWILNRREIETRCSKEKLGALARGFYSGLIK
jgi:hypothetical protein